MRNRQFSSPWVEPVRTHMREIEVRNIGTYSFHFYARLHRLNCFDLKYEQRSIPFMRCHERIVFLEVIFPEIRFVDVKTNIQELGPRLLRQRRRQGCSRRDSADEGQFIWGEHPHLRVAFQQGSQLIRRTEQSVPPQISGGPSGARGGLLRQAFAAENSRWVPRANNHLHYGDWGPNQWDQPNPFSWNP